MKPPRLRYRCRDCQWFAPHQATETFNPTGGWCWRFPPVSVAVPNPPRMVEDGHAPAVVEAHRPYVDQDDGCGEWQAQR